MAVVSVMRYIEVYQKLDRNDTIRTEVKKMHKWKSISRQGEIKLCT